MPNKIKPKRSYTTGAVPTASDLDTNEVAINWTDSKLYTKTASGNIVSVTLGGGGSGLTWSSVPASATATGTAGQIAYDDTNGFFYVATATNTWKRASLSAWYPNTPSTISGLQLWLDAADPATLYDATSGGSLVNADGIVRRWEDKSGNGRHASEATYGPTRKTSQQNGYSALLFNGSNTFLAGSSTPSTGNVRTAFAITKSANTSGSDFFQIGGYANSSSRLFSLRQSYGSPNSGISSDMIANNVNVNGEQLTINQYHVSCWRQTSSTRAVRYWHNGTEKTVTGTPDSFSAAAGFLVGKGRTSVDQGYWNGYVSEIIVYDVEISDADRATVESYLKAKWVIA
jgi:hypothetical protein